MRNENVSTALAERMVDFRPFNSRNEVCTRLNKEEKQLKTLFQACAL
jgi:hypothetical protein